MILLKQSAVPLICVIYEILLNRVEDIKTVGNYFVIGYPVRCTGIHTHVHTHTNTQTATREHAL